LNHKKKDNILSEQSWISRFAFVNKETTQITQNAFELPSLIITEVIVRSSGGSDGFWTRTESI
jgi:hypothetical protein